MKTCVVLALFLTAGLSLGDIQKRILGGRPCTEDTKQFVFLQTNGICSGSIVGDGSWVLTAKHCTKYGTHFTIKDSSGKEIDKSNQIIPNPDADIMLIKMNVQKETSAIEVADQNDCPSIMNDLNSNKPVDMVLVGRGSDKGDKVLCGDIKMNSYIDLPPDGPYFIGTPTSNPQDGDSGGGLIRKAANKYKLFAVFFSASQGLATGVDVCDGKISKWIRDNMK